MIDPIAIVGDRIRYWAEINNPQEGAGRFDTYWSTLRVGGFKELQYGNAYPASVDPVVLETAEFINGSSVANKQNFTVSKTTTETFSWSLKEAISTKVSGEAGIPFVAEGKVEVAISFEGTQSKTITETRTWSHSTDINIPPKKRIVTTFVVSQGKYLVPFRAKVPVRGKVWIQFASRKWWGAEIDALINDANWRPSTFDCEIEGTFDGVHGLDYRVKVEEFELPLPGEVSASAVPISTRIVDSGVMSDGKLQRELSDKGPEQ